MTLTYRSFGTEFVPDPRADEELAEHLSNREEAENREPRGRSLVMKCPVVRALVHALSCQREQSADCDNPKADRQEDATEAQAGVRLNLRNDAWLLRQVGNHADEDDGKDVGKDAAKARHAQPVITVLGRRKRVGRDRSAVLGGLEREHQTNAEEKVDEAAERLRDKQRLSRMVPI